MTPIVDDVKMRVGKKAAFAFYADGRFVLIDLRESRGERFN